MIQTISSTYSTKDKIYLLYYLILSILTLLLTKPEFAIGGFYRIIYLVAVFVPLLFNKKYIPVIITLFVGFSFTSFYQLLPSAIVFYPPIILIFYVLCFPKLNFRLLLFLLYLLYFFFIEAFSYLPTYDFIYWFIASLLLSQLLNNQRDVDNMLFSFVILSFLLSLLYIINYDSFSVQYIDTNLDRSGWINPNVFGGVVGLGLVCSFYILLLSLERRTLIRFVSILTCILGYIVLILNASRGAILASTFAILFMLTFSNIKWTFKLLYLALVVVFFVILYQLGYFELLESRLMSDDTSSAGGRFDIWKAKYEAFGNLPLFRQVVGIGYSECLSLGNVYKDTHNDFFTALFAYGYIGLIIFLFYLFGPIIITPKHAKKKCLVFELFICMESMSLSPIMRGYFVFIMFMFVLYRMAFIERKSTKRNNIYESCYSMLT